MSASTTSPPTVPLWEVEQELSRQIREFQGDDPRPVFRARMSNLVIFCGSAAQGRKVETDLSDIVAVHPCRVLLLVEDADAPEGELQANPQVWPVRVAPRKYVYSDQVTMRTGPVGLYRLPFAVRSLFIGDLPTNLWWAAPTPPSLAGPLLHDLAEYAEQIVYDSLGWPEPTRGVAATATWLDQLEKRGPGGRWRVASDLNWRRLKYWRRLLMQSLDPVSAPGARGSAGEILIEHGPHAVVQAWELASWLSCQLGWRVQGGKVSPGVEMTWRFAAGSGAARVRIRRLDAGPPEIRRVVIRCQINAQPATLDLKAVDGRRLSIHVEVRDISCEPRTISLPPQSPAEVVGRQLSDRERDPVFRESMAVAQVMARSLLH
jgi:glucose-6-phosphate dehydrogenase assembly protein OpcA